MDKFLFTDKRIGMLLASNAKYSLCKDECNFEEGCRYRWAIEFTVGDECLTNCEVELSKIKGVENG